MKNKTMVVLLLLSTNVWAADPFVGRWVLNVAKSKYAAGTCPKSMVIEMKAVGQGVRYHSETTFANGNTTSSEYLANYDGRPVVVNGAHGMLLPVSLKRTAPNNVTASYSKSLQVVATSRRVISADRRHMTITTSSREPNGKVVTNMGVYDRQAPAMADR